MNGALVIPKLMYIKFYRTEVERTVFLIADKRVAGLKINKKSPDNAALPGPLQADLA